MVNILVCVVTDLHSMNRYQRNEFLHYANSFWFGPQAVTRVEGMSIDERNIELSYQALLAFKQFEQNRSKPILDSIMLLVRYGASADCQICLQEGHIEKRFTPLYLALVANSITHAQKLLEKGVRTDVVWSISTIAKTDRPFCYSALQVADRWCHDSGEIKHLIRKYEMQKNRKE